MTDSFYMDLMKKLTGLQDQISALRTIEIGGVWTDFTPALSASGSMTISAESGLVGRYSVIGKLCFVGVRAIFTTGGTASTAIYINTPISPHADISNDYTAFQFAARMVDGGSANIAMGGMLDAGGGVYKLAVQKYDLSNWGLGTTRQIRISGFYRI